MAERIKVMLVDDSAVVRQTLQNLLSEADDIEVIATAQDPYVAVAKLRQSEPDVIILDVEMPRMDGVTFLRKIMSQHPIPVIICSSLVGEGSHMQMEALAAGAVDIIVKPALGTRSFLQESRIRIFDAVRAAAKARLQPLQRQMKQSAPRLTADAVLPPTKSRALSETTEKIILIGASTGGTEAIRVVLESMPTDCPAIAIVQHMPEGFTRSFANRLNGLCRIRVKEAEDGDTLLRGHALIAPGNQHLVVKRSGARYYVQVQDGPLVSRHKPSVNVLFRSGAHQVGANAVAALLTGMGDDGADGMKELHDTGAWTCNQDEATSVVYGMPKEARRRGGSQRELALGDIAPALLEAGMSKRGR